MALLAAACARLSTALVLLLLLTGCETLGYYTQAVSGQLKLLYNREPVDEVLETLAREDLSDEERRLKSQLELSQELLAYAQETLGLEVDGRYRSYVELSEPNVVWNLFAAPELSLEPKVWCYPFVGCAPYRGYFERASAERYRAKLDEQGFDTYLGGVAAYSTLGWFDDPLLSSFISWPEPRLAELLFHELAHSRVWVGGDVAFNEAFATFVGRQGMESWLEAQGRSDALAAHDARSAARRGLRSLLLLGKESLAVLYAQPLPEAELRARKAGVLEAMAGCVDRLPGLGAGDLDRYRTFLAGANNALFVSVATYEDRVPAFAALFAREGSSWPAFFEAVEVLAALDDGERRGRLASLAEGQVADDADDDGTNQIQCEALARHGLDAEATG